MNSVLSPGERNVLARFEIAARDGSPCPSNGEMALDMGCALSSIGKMVAALVEKQAVRVETISGNTRVVEIVSSGLRTGRTKQVGMRRTAIIESDRRKPAAVLTAHEPCFYCGARPDACACANRRAVA